MLAAHNFGLLLLKEAGCPCTTILMLLHLLFKLLLKFHTLQNSSWIGFAWKLGAIFIIVLIITQRFRVAIRYYDVRCRVWFLTDKLNASLDLIFRVIWLFIVILTIVLLLIKLMVLHLLLLLRFLRWLLDFGACTFFVWRRSQAHLLFKKLFFSS